MVEAEEEPPSPYKDDTAYYLGYLTYLVEKSREEGTEDEHSMMPKGVDDEEALRLAIEASRARPHQHQGRRVTSGRRLLRWLHHRKSLWRLLH
jgi:hypothetical protein